MEYELNIDSQHLIEWLKEDVKTTGTPRFEIAATRTFVAEPISNEDAAVSEDVEVQFLATVGDLEVSPRNIGLGTWTLRVRVEDVLGPHLPEDGSVSDEPEEMTLDAFEADFILPNRGATFVTLVAETQKNKDAFDRFRSGLLIDRHPE